MDSEMDKLIEGAPKKVRLKKKKFTLEVEQDIYDRVIRIAKKKGFKPAEVYRILLSTGLRLFEEMEHEQDGPDGSNGAGEGPK